LLIDSKTGVENERDLDVTPLSRPREVFEVRLKHFFKTSVRSTIQDPFLRPSWERAKCEMRDKGISHDLTYKSDILSQAMLCFYSMDSSGRFNVGRIPSPTTVSSIGPNHMVFILC
jgi:hypothetical protein